jgi:hypothetical protein
MIEEKKKFNTPSLKKVLRGLGVLQSGIRARKQHLDLLGLMKESNKFY